MKTKHPVHFMVFGKVTGDSDVMPPFIFPHGLKLNMEAYTKCMEKVVLPWIKRMAAGRSYNRTLCHDTQAGEPSLGCQKISDHITPKI